MPAPGAPATLPHLFELLEVSEEPLSTSELVVCHHRRGEVVATERHRAP